MSGLNVKANQSPKIGTHRIRSRGSVRRIVGVAAAAVLMGSTLAACGGSSDDDEGAAEGDFSGKTVKLGVAMLPPFVIKDGDDVTGDTPEIARAVLKEMGITKVETVLVDFDGLIPGLQAGRYDIIASALAIRPERCDIVNFSTPYVASPTGFAVKTGNPKNLTKYEDFADGKAKLGVMAGGSNIVAAKEVGVSADNIQSYPDILAGLAALSSGRVDAFASDPISLAFSIKESNVAGVETTPQFVEKVNGKDNPGAAGFAFRKDDADFRDAFDKALNEFGAESMAAIGAQFDIPEDAYTLAASYTAAQLCK